MRQLSLRMRFQSRTPWFVALSLAAAFILAWPLLSEPGLLNTRGGGDSPFLLQRLQQLTTAVADGHFPVRWMPDANYGYGYPFYNFYAPLSIYIAAFFRWFGFTFVRSIHLAQLTGFLVAAVGMFFLARRWFQQNWAGLLAAIAYSAAPFHMVNVYVRGDSLAEFWAMAFYPLTLLAVDGLFEHTRRGSGRKTAVALLGLAYAALILSHNISALIFSPFLLLYILLRWLSHQPTAVANLRLQLSQYGLPALLSLVLALALAAWFFVPALAEQSLAQLDPVTEGYFHFSNHFLGSEGRPLLQTSFFFDYDVDSFAAFRMGLMQALTILGGVLVLLVTWKRPGLIRPYRRFFILITLLVSIFMLLPLSNWFWENLPLLSFTQFPWRFLSVQAFAGALATGAIALLPWRKMIVPVTAVMLLGAALGALQTDHLFLSDADVTGEKLAQYEWFSGNIGTTVSAEYLPPTVQPRLFTSDWLNRDQRWELQALNNNLQSAQLLQRQTTTQSWQMSLSAAADIVFPLLYWPGWQAKVDGRPLAIQPAPGSGLVQLSLPAGEHQVNLQLARTPIRLLAEIVSLTAVVILLWLFLSNLRPRQVTNQQKRWAGAGVVSLFILFVLAQLWPQPVYSDDDLNWDFGQMAYLSHAPQGIPFSNSLSLKHYQFNQEIMQPGDSLIITTNWFGAATADPITLQLTTPASHRQRQPSPPILVEQTQTIVNDQAIFTLDIPATAPPGLIVPRLLIANSQALTPAGRERGALYLRPLLLENQTMAQVATPSLAVETVAVQQRDDNTLDIHLAWHTAQPLTHNYNVALRLTDARGQFLQLADMQPGYGYQPSSLWPASEWTFDWLAMDLPAAEHEMPYYLIAQLIDITRPNQPILTRRLGELWPEGDMFTFQPTEPKFDLPAGIERETAVIFAEAINLAGHTINQTEDSLQVTLVWESLAQLDRDYTRFVHLVPTAGNQPPAAQDDNLPVNGTYPVSQWQTYELIEDQIRLDLAAIPAGDYQLIVGFYELLEDGSILRLTAVDQNGSPLADNQYQLPQTITIP